MDMKCSQILNIRASIFQGTDIFLKSKKAFNDPNNKDIVNLNSVIAFFYFSDNSVLEIKSDKGLYNNTTLDMNFYQNVNAVYKDTNLMLKLPNILILRILS